jgi:X-Pro dipeptidyl-peptidase
MTERHGNEHHATRRRVLQATAGAVAATGAAGTATATDDVEIEDGRAQPVFADDEVVREDYWVETDTDTDGSGRPDRIHVEVARPASTDEAGVRLPVILQPSPYWGNLDRDVRAYSMERQLYVPGEDDDAPAEPERVSDAEAEALKETITDESFEDEERTWFEETFGRSVGTSDAADSIGPRSYEEEFLDRGFVFAYVASLGSERSTGCVTVGDRREVDGVKSVVDWLNGRTMAYDARTGGQPQTATFATGKCGSIGHSYNGFLSLAVATTGVDGLECVTPSGAVTSWYTYLRSNGAVISTGPGPNKGLAVQTMFDYVDTRKNDQKCDPVEQRLRENQDRRTGNYDEFWAERDYARDERVADVDAGVFLVHGLADDNVKTRNAARLAAALDRNDVPHRTWLHSAGHRPPVREHRERWYDLLNRWWTHWLLGVDNGVLEEPAATVERTDDTLDSYEEWPHPAATGVDVALRPGGTGRGGLALDPPAPVEESFTDDPETPPQSLYEPENGQNRLVYRSEPLAESLHLSGTIRPDLRLSFSKRAALVSVALFDVAPDGSRTLVNRGWANATNRNSLREADPLTPGEEYRVEFPINAVDRVFEAGHRLAVMVYSSDQDFTKRPDHDLDLTLSLADSAVELPVVGGESALAASLDVEGGDGGPRAVVEVGSRSVAAGESLTVDGGESSDPDGWIASYEWAFGDGTTATGETASHAYDDPGEYAVELTVEDDTGRSATATTTVTVGEDDGNGGTTTYTGSLREYGSATRTHAMELSAPTGATASLSGDAGTDFDLYLTTDGRTPTTDDFDRRSWSDDSEESITVEELSAGQRLGLLVDAYDGSGEFELTVEERGE